MKAALIITGLTLAWLGAWWLARRDHTARTTKLQRVLDAHNSLERAMRDVTPAPPYPADPLGDLIRDLRDDPPQAGAWPLHTRFPCGCVRFFHAEPRWQRCSFHVADGQRETWPI